tara:strand:- start:375 stop:1394 length:1020 start_codon:yes stop_codon:yes gene_type:complete
METGANASVWGTNTNNNLEIIDSFDGGYLAKSVAGSANVTLTTVDGATDNEASNKVIEFTGTLTGAIYVFVPAVESNYIFFNNTAGAFSLTVAPTGHSANGIAITQGAHTIIYNKDTNDMKDLFDGSLGVVGVKGTVNVSSTIGIAANGEVSATSFTGDGSGLSGVVTIPATTQMVFYQSSAPSGWTQNTAASLANSTLRIITSGTAGTGGTDAFETVFVGSKLTTAGDISVDSSPLSVDASGISAGATSVSIPQIASHNHGIPLDTAQNNGGANRLVGQNPVYGPNIYPTSSTGGGGSHTHPVSITATVSGNFVAPAVQFTVPAMDIKHANVIVAAKD